MSDTSEPPSPATRAPRPSSNRSAKAAQRKAQRETERKLKRREGERRKRRKRRRRTVQRMREAPTRARRKLQRGLGTAIKRRRLALRRLSARLAPRRWDHQLRDLARAADTPIIVGPWTNEVGYEVLYWIPLLRRAFQSAGIPPERVIALSRGGVASWYAPIASRYVDIYELVSPEQLLAATTRRITEQGGQRQLRATYEDIQLAREAARHLGLDMYLSLHPAAMYDLLTGYLRGFRPAKEITSRCDHSMFPAPYARHEGLPFDGDYTVCKFYANPSFPRTAENEAFVDTLVRRLAERGPVVMLNTGLTLDDHGEFPCPDGTNVFNAASLVTATDNLGVQTALTACSRGFIGTYGGFSYLAPLLGVRGVGVFSGRQFVPAHLGTASALFADGAAGYSAMHTSSVELLLSHRVGLREG